jgi:hypothetical protein
MATSVLNSTSPAALTGAWSMSTTPAARGDVSVVR